MTQHHADHTKRLSALAVFTMLLNADAASRRIGKGPTGSKPRPQDADCFGFLDATLRDGLLRSLGLPELRDLLWELHEPVEELRVEEAKLAQAMDVLIHLSSVKGLIERVRARLDETGPEAAGKALELVRLFRGIARIRGNSAVRVLKLARELSDPEEGAAAHARSVAMARLLCRDAELGRALATLHREHNPRRTRSGAQNAAAELWAMTFIRGQYPDWDRDSARRFYHQLLPRAV